jgi:hypothetical protein
MAARLTARVKSLGATGYTLTECRGEGSRGVRAADVPGTGVRIETVVDVDVAGRIVAVMAEEYFPDYAVIVWVSDVEVVRGDKYVTTAARQSS